MAINKLVQLKDTTTQVYSRLYPVVVKQSIQDTSGNPISVAQTKQVEAVATRVTAIQQSMKGGSEAFLTITELPSDNLIQLQGIPVGVRTSTGNYYPLQKETYNPDTGVLDLTSYLLYEQNIFTQPWLIYYTSQITPVLQCNYLDVTSVDGYIIVPDQTIPVSVQINGIVVDLDNTWMIHQGTTFKILQQYILTTANIASYQGTYRVWRAGGQKGDQGQRGQKGDAFTYEDFTQEQLEALRGPQGVQGPANTLTIGTVTTLEPTQSATAQITGESPNQVLSLGLPRGEQGQKGDAFTYEDFTQQQLEALRGPQGIQGEQGVPGIIQGNYLDVTATDGYIVVPDQTVPVSVQVNGIIVDIDNSWMVHQNTTFKILQQYILTTANLASYTGTYRVWRAGGSSRLQTSGARFMRFTSGDQICWGNTQTLQSFTTIVFPQPFTQDVDSIGISIIPVGSQGSSFMSSVWIQDITSTQLMLGGTTQGISIKWFITGKWK